MSDPRVFEALSKPIRRLIVERGFAEATKPQIEAIPLILKGENILLIAPTGTGKTEAAFLPILQMLLSHPRILGVKVVYVTPLRALNRDLLDRLEWWCGRLDLKISVRHGDTEVRERRKQALSPPDILVTTPETLQILLNGRRFSQHLACVKWVIVDEVHELVDNKRGTQLSLSLERLRWISGRDFQVVGLSATIGSPDEVAHFLVGVGRRCKVVDVTVARDIQLDVIHPTPKRGDHKLASQLYTFPEVAARLRAMRDIIERHGSTLIFTNTRPMAEILASRFRIWDLNFPVSIHHGSLSSLSRVRTEEMLKGGELKGVICTSSLELGIDVGAVDLCIQYNSPRQVTRLLQRTGRSGHWVGGLAKGVVVVQDPDDALESIVIVGSAYRRDLEPVSIPEKPLDVMMHELAGMMIYQRRWSISEAYEIFRNAYAFKDLTKADIERVLKYMEGFAQRLAWRSSEDDAFGRPLRHKRLFKYYFDNLSMIPVIKQYLVINEAKNTPVGVLDESFLAQFGSPGVKFVMGGSVWKTVQVFRERVYVKPDEDPLGAIPSWVGEEIPVPYTVAQEVGRVRGRVEELVKEGHSLPEISNILIDEYRVDHGVMVDALRDTYEQAGACIPLPSDRRITLEKWKNLIIVHTHFGTLINRTLSRYLASWVFEMLGETASVFDDPYRVFIRSEHLSPEELMEAFKGGFDKGFEEVVRRTILEDRLFKWRLVQVARRMGALEREADLDSKVVDQLLKGLRGTIVYEEAFKEVINKDLDLRGTIEALEDIRGGEIELVSLGQREEPTPITKTCLKWRTIRLEPVSPKRLRFLSIASTKARLLSEVRTFTCVSCKEYIKERRVYDLDDELRCPLCGSPDIGMAEERAEEIQRISEMQDRLPKRSRGYKIWRGILETSKVISKYGKAAAVALTGDGITPEVAVNILKREKRLTGKFFELVVEAEKKRLIEKFSPKRAF
ncbi:MAG: DEAD/DEAH box helicase [Candidatus Geothermarchaeales archaeon]